MENTKQLLDEWDAALESMERTVKDIEDTDYWFGIFFVLVTGGGLFVISLLMGLSYAGYIKL